MTDTLEKPEGAEGSPPVAAEARPNKLGPTAYGNGPVIAAGFLVGGALLLGGWGMVQMIGDHPAKEPAAVAAPAPAPDPGLGEARKNGDGTVTIRLPDKDGNGVPDAFEGKGPTTGRGDEGDPKGPEDPAGHQKTPPAHEEPRNRVYTIQWGDTLTSISAQTGVPIGVLVETNRIQDPNLIYAGSALLIPPTE